MYLKTVTLLLIFSTMSFAENHQINYHFKVTDAQHHLAEVTVTFPEVNFKSLEVQLPVWRSGRYEILNLSKAVRHFTATDQQNNVLNWDKTNKNSWRIFLQKPGAVTIKYQVYANSLKHRVIHIDATHAYLDASGVFMFAPEFRDHPLTVQMDAPDDWQSRSGMEKLSAHQFVATNYDQLVDSPIESGIHQFVTFKVADKQYEIVIWGAGNHDIQDLQQQVTLLHHAGKQIWGDFPFERYLYIFHAGDGLRGATEHVNSTIIQQHRFNFAPRDKYLKVLATTAHEFIHTWNVKAYRPAGIAPYDYSEENYSDLFWMAEGITSYYDDLMLMRTGIYQPDEFHSKLAENILKHLNNPGKAVQSVASSSFDTWLKSDAQQNHNQNVSIYLEGAMVAWLLDQQIRTHSADKYGLDELQKRLYQQHRNIDQGYQKHDVLHILSTITEHDFTPFWNDYVEGVKAIDFDALLDFYGLQMVTKDSNKQPTPDTWIGAAFAAEGGLAQIKTVSRDSPAWQAGLTAGDHLVAINGLKVTADDIDDRIKLLSPGEHYNLHYFNAGSLLETTLSPIRSPHSEFEVKTVDNPSKKQQKRYQAWAHQTLDSD